ncbi:hypothetical protein MC885_002448 [Smutsia gigantea]|nr:hypothetical protein MC885_002448 [Smutsia gigantea]
MSQDLCRVRVGHPLPVTTLFPVQWVQTSPWRLAVQMDIGWPLSTGTAHGPTPQTLRNAAHFITQGLSNSDQIGMVQEQCCYNQLQELHCATGINLANEQDSCTMPPGDNTSLEATFVKRCCHCCLLGRAAQAQGQSCEYSLMVGYQCGLVFRACYVTEPWKHLGLCFPTQRPKTAADLWSLPFYLVEGASTSEGLAV